MKMFISWSGEKSRIVAAALKDWIPMIIQAVDPWFSDSDIAKGSAWNSEVRQQLSFSQIGIICLTAENRERPWIHFEAGAIANAVGNLQGLVVTFIIDFSATELPSPLAGFQYTLPTKDDIRKLMADLNSRTPSPLSPSRLNSLFDDSWHRLEEALKASANLPAPEVQKKSQEEMIADVLEAVRQVDGRVRAIERAMPRRSPVIRHLFDNPAPFPSLEDPKVAWSREIIEELKRQVLDPLAAPTSLSAHTPIASDAEQM